MTRKKVNKLVPFARSFAQTLANSEKNFLVDIGRRRRRRRRRHRKRNLRSTGKLRALYTAAERVTD